MITQDSFSLSAKAIHQGDFGDVISRRSFREVQFSSIAKSIREQNFQQRLICNRIRTGKTQCNSKRTCYAYNPVIKDC